MKNQVQSPLLTSIVISSRYLSVWIALVLLIVAAYFIAPETLTRTSFSAVLPLTSFLALAALGQMLVVMTGGIDLSIPGVMTLSAIMAVGIAGTSDERLPVAILSALGVSLLIGFISGVLVGVLKLNPLIVTLAVGQIVYGATLAYADIVPNEASVPPSFAEWTNTITFGLSNIEWTAIAASLLFVLVFRYTELGRKFKSVGATPLAARVLGLRV